jgi:hypothetical protein
VTKRRPPLSLPPSIAEAVYREARKRGWEASAYLAHLAIIGQRVLDAMRVNVGAKGR